jgi:hypothetical protein
MPSVVCGGKGHRLVAHDRHVAAATPHALSRRRPHILAHTRRPAHLRARTHAPRAVRISSERSSDFPTRWWGYVPVISTRRPESSQLAPIMQEQQLLAKNVGGCAPRELGLRRRPWRQHGGAAGTEPTPPQQRHAHPQVPQELMYS